MQGATRKGSKKDMLSTGPMKQAIAVDESAQIQRTSSYNDLQAQEDNEQWDWMKMYTPAKIGPPLCMSYISIFVAQGMLFSLV
jgi:hypothetical protein